MNPLYIDLKASDSIEVQISAIVNVLNAITHEMYEGRVQQNKEAAEEQIVKIQSNIVESVVDEYNIVIGG